MRDAASWSLSLGRWRGVHVRLHAFFLLFAVFTLYLAADEGDAEIFRYGLLAIGILLLSVLLHEIGHCVAALRVGGFPDEIILAPLGGLTEVPVPHDPASERIASVGGPAANLLLALLCAPVLIYNEIPIANLLNPLRPALDSASDRLWVGALSLTFWINWALAILNLLPAFPFDGGRLLRSLVWPRLGNFRAASIRVARVAQIVAICLGAAAAFAAGGDGSSPIPLWAPLVLLAIFLYFGAKQQLERITQEAAEPEERIYDLSPDYFGLATDLRRETRPERKPGKLAEWLAKRKQIKKRREEIRQADEEFRADQILARVHTDGIESISDEERLILERVSARYRDRYQD